MELSREDKMIKQLCKTFKEDTDSYWLNTQRYIEWPQNITSIQEECRSKWKCWISV